MNKLQQEIKLFHDKLEPILEKVLEQYHKKNTEKIYNTIMKPCKKLIQKCSYKSISDTSCLCSLAYWLYIYGDKELALEICEIAHVQGQLFAIMEGPNQIGEGKIISIEIKKYELEET